MSNDYTLDLDVTQTTDSLGNTYTALVMYGVEYAVVGWELKEERTVPGINTFSKNEVAHSKYQVWLDLRRVPL